jgi:hypothetical protein
MGNNLASTAHSGMCHWRYSGHKSPSEVNHFPMGKEGEWRHDAEIHLGTDLALRQFGSLDRAQSLSPDFQAGRREVVAVPLYHP